MQFTRWFVAGNVAAAFAFLLVASNFWIEPELADISGASGGAAIVWGLIAFPIFVVAMLVNMLALGWAVVARTRRGVWPFTMAAWLVPAVWVASLLVDHAHHGTP